MNCYLFGNNSLAVECAARLLKNNHRLEGILTGDPTLSEWANSHSVPVLDPRDKYLASKLARHPFDLLLSVAYLSIIPTEVIALARTAAVNFHDGPLPDTPVSTLRPGL